MPRRRAKQSSAPFEVGIQHHFGVAPGLKAPAQPLQLLAEGAVVVDFAVENNCVFAVEAVHRLIAALEVDDSKPCGSQRDMRGAIACLLVGTPVDHALNSSIQDAARKAAGGVRVTDNPTHKCRYRLPIYIIFRSLPTPRKTDRKFFRAQGVFSRPLNELPSNRWKNCSMIQHL